MNWNNSTVNWNGAFSDIHPKLGLLNESVKPGQVFSVSTHGIYPLSPGTDNRQKTPTV